MVTQMENKATIWQSVKDDVEIAMIVFRQYEKQGRIKPITLDEIKCNGGFECNCEQIVNKL